MKMLKFQVDFDVYAGPPVAVIISDDDHHHHKSGFSVNLHVLGFLVAGALFLFISLWFLCCYCVKIEQARLRFHNMFQRVEVVIDEEQVLQVEEDDDDPVDHPIWYIRTQGLQQSVVDSIMVVKYRKIEGLVEGSDCSICLSEFEEDESLRLLPKCAHAFHVPCIDQWFRSHKNCPLCRAPVAHLVVAGPPMLPATSEEDRGEAEEEEEEENDGEMATVDVNISVEDSDSAESENGAKNESCLGESHRVQAVRRWVSAGPVTASKMYGALTEIKIQADSSSSSVQMMRSASHGGKPSSAAGRSQNTTLSN